MLLNVYSLDFLAKSDLEAWFDPGSRDPQDGVHKLAHASRDGTLVAFGGGFFYLLCDTKLSLLQRLESDIQTLSFLSALLSKTPKIDWACDDPVLHSSDEHEDDETEEDTDDTDDTENEDAHVQQQEPAAQINPIEAAEIVALQHGSFVQRGIATLARQDVNCYNNSHETIVLCKLNRMTASLRNALCDGIPLRQCRTALIGDGHKWRLPGGALVFVQPWQFRSVMHALGSKELHADHLIVSSSMDHLVQETLEMSARGTGSWVKDRCQLMVEDAGSVAATAGHHGIDQADQYGLVVERTFLNSAPKRRPEAEVTQSTTASRMGPNPRAAIGDMS